MGFLTAFLYYACLFVVLVLVAAAGVFVGKKLRDRKDAKKSKEAESEITIEQLFRLINERYEEVWSK